MSNERSRDFGRAQSRGSDGGDDRRDSGEEALLELARLIGGQTDPFSPEMPKSESRLAAAPGGSFEERAPGRRDTDFGEPRAPSRAGDRFDFPEPHSDYDFADDRGPRSGRGLAPHDDYEDDEYAEADDYDEGEPERKRRPTRMVLALLSLAVFGSAAAYGYRTMIAAPSGPTPIIRADNSPTRITPMSDVKPEGGRIGRIGGRIGERLVRRDEDPVNIGTSAGSAGGASSDAVPAASERALPDDPRRVRTVPIRADQGTASSPDRPDAQAAMPPSQTSPAPRHQAAARPSAHPPLPPQRQAALAPSDTPAPPAVPVEPGNYIVQLVAVHSEADAQSEFRRLQAKFSSVLSGRQPLIRRKDRGDQGIIFAAGVGPFEAKNEADQLCGQLKAAGGNCYVYKY